MDKKEKAERSEAATAYADEDPKLYRDYILDCVSTSQDQLAAVRGQQALLWRTYQEDEPDSYQFKEDWQSRTIVPKPHHAVQSGKAAIRKAFSPDFLSVKNPKDPAAARFWQAVMDRQFDQMHSDFIRVFSDAVEMSLAVGVSMEIIPVYTSEHGLKFLLVEPWKILRDPDAQPRDPQSGMFWIHSEWMQKWQLKKGEKNGRYRKVDEAFEASSSGSGNNDYLTDKESIAARRHQIYQESAFRKKIQVYEFYGMALDKQGNVLLENANMTLAGNTLIQPPEAVPYGKLRWPGISFSPMPDLLSGGGRGLLNGVVRLWESINNIFCLHEDALKWIVNPPLEVEVERLEDPEDVECWPGKAYMVRESVNGNAAIRPLNRRDNTNSILANMQYMDQLFEGGSFVTAAVQGLPGYRQEITATETRQNKDQGMAVFQLMGDNVEMGAILAIAGAHDVISSLAGKSDYEAMFSQEELQEMGVALGVGPENSVEGVPRLDGSFHVSGIQALMKDQETLDVLMRTVIPLAGDPKFGKYINPYNVVLALEKRTGLADEKIFVEKETGEQIQAADLQNAAMPQAPETGGNNILAKMAGGA